MPEPRGQSLIDLPLWRLLVALHDAERSSGPTAAITRELAAAVKERLRSEDVPDPPAGSAMRRGA
jgi:hypothetical protein